MTQTMRRDHLDVIISPVVSEKSYKQLDNGKYTFLVHPDANKTQVRIAIEKIFNVSVVSVNTFNRRGKAKRTRFGYGKRKNTKRAVVALAEGEHIDIFGPPAT